MEKYIVLLKDLMAIRSVSADTAMNNLVTETLYTFLKENSTLHCTVEEFQGRKILYASTVPGKNPDLMLNAHLDVVPAEEESWTIRVEEDWVYGRGSVDCKGNAVAIVKALCEMEEGVSAGAIFTVDEEVGGFTTGYMVEQGYYPKRMTCIMDSWNNDTICYAQKGILVVKLTAHGKGGHSSAPWAFDNPLDKLMDGYLRFRSLWQNPGKEDPWHKTMAGTVIRGGAAVNQIPDTAELILNFRYIENGEKEEILKMLEVTGLEVSVLENCLPVCVSTSAKEFEILSSILEKHIGTFNGYRKMNGATDARHFASLNQPIVIIGVQGDGAHALVEKVSLSSIAKYAQILKDLASALKG